MENLTTHTCPKCHQPVLETDVYCQNCAYPIKGTEEEQKEHGIKQWEKDFNRQDNEKKLKNGTTTLFVVAGLFVFSGVVLYALAQDSASLIIYLILAGIYVGLGFASKTHPFPSVLIGLILFILVIILGVVEGVISKEPRNIFSGIIVKIIVLLYLGRALRSAHATRNNS